MAFDEENEDDFEVSSRLVGELQIPDYTKSFVFAIRELESKAVIYILYVYGLSERSAADTEYLIRAVHPDAVITDWTWANEFEHDYGDYIDEPIPSSTFKVVKSCFLYRRTNKDRYLKVARNWMAQECFGVGYESHHLVAKRVAEDIGSSFLMVSPNYIWTKPLEPESVELSSKRSYEPPLFSQYLYPMFTGLSRFFTLGSLHSALASAQKLLIDVHSGDKVDTVILSEVYNFRYAVEVLRQIKYQQDLGRFPHSHDKSKGQVGTEVKFFELSDEEQSQCLASHGLRAQAQKFKKIVFISSQQDLKGIRKFWGTPIFPETKDVIRQHYVSRENSGVEISSADTTREKRPTELAAGTASVLAASFLFKKNMSPVYQFIRRERRGLVPWFAYAGFGGWLHYGDAIVSLPSAPSIARLGRGIQNLQQASSAVDQSHTTQIHELQEQFVLEYLQKFQLNSL